MRERGSADRDVFLPLLVLLLTPSLSFFFFLYSSSIDTISNSPSHAREAVAKAASGHARREIVGHLIPDFFFEESQACLACSLALAFTFDPLAPSTAREQRSKQLGSLWFRRFEGREPEKENKERNRFSQKKKRDAFRKKRKKKNDEKLVAPISLPKICSEGKKTSKTSEE